MVMRRCYIKHNATVAEQLHLTGAVRNPVNTICARLELTCRIQAIVLAIQHSLDA
jgi:DNA-binding NarL/FixJ family response regulator